MKQPPEDSRRVGFTLIELLVTLAIISVLIALILPAVMRARESVRAVSCKNKLRQIGIALHNYADSHRSFPPGNIMVSGWDSGDGTHINWAISLLPYMEERAVWGQYDSGLPNHAAANEEVTSTGISMYQCPSDPNSGTTQRPWSGPGRQREFAVGSYRGVAGRSDGEPRPHGGTWFDAPNSLPRAWQGVLPQAGTGVRSVRLSDITDGTSNTLAVGEYYTRPCPQFGGGSPCRRSTFWGYSYTSYSLSSVCPECGPRTLFEDYDLCVTAGTSEPGGIAACKRAWGSFHSSLHFLLCDGSVRNVDHVVDLELLGGLATIHGGEVTNF